MTTTELPATRTLRIEGAATLLSSLVHGGEHHGTIASFRREKIIEIDGKAVDVPIVSGNALRGLLRDHAAHIMWDALGRPQLPPPVFHLLWSGGSLAKAGSGHVIGARQLAEVRRLIPLVSLFGGSGAGKIIEGKLRVGKLTPICAETAHLLPDTLVDQAEPRPMWELLQVEEFTRRDDAKRDQLHPAIEGMARPELGTGDEQGQLLEVADHAPAAEDELDGPAQQMRYGVETLAAGTRLHWWMSLHQVTDPEVALFAAAIDRWTADGAHLGGRAATGHGRLRLDVHQWSHQTPATTVGEALDVAGRDHLVDHVDQHRAEILEALEWFA